MRVGVHTSIAGGLENAAYRAHLIGCDAFQIFSANPRGWSVTRNPIDGGLGVTAPLATRAVSGYTLRVDLAGLGGPSGLLLVNGLL